MIRITAIKLNVGFYQDKKRTFLKWFCFINSFTVLISMLTLAQKFGNL
jgi:hypothetical protein